MTEYPVIHLKKSDEKYDWFELIDDCKFQEITIPKGYTTDFASVPQVFWGIIPPHCKAAMPSIIHDFTCEYGIYARKKCDQIFLELLRKSGVTFWQRSLMYAYVRLFGWIRYNRRLRE